MRVVLERDRAQQEREGGGRRHRPGHRVCREMRHEEIELVLGELEPLPVGEVGGVQDHERSAPARREIAEALPLEDLLVVVLGGEIDPAEPDRGQSKPVQRVGGASDQGGLHVHVEETRPEVGEDPLAEEAVVGGGEGAARDGGDAVHLVEQALLHPLPDDPGVAKPLEHPIGQRGCPGAPAREGEADEQRVRVLSRRLQGLEAVRKSHAGVGQRIVEGVVGAARAGEQGRQDEDPKTPTRRGQSRSPAARARRYP
jgi:hypothetical protein